ncbi:MAG: hypothetical protein RLZZ242_1029 [Bacteroidota bacterium]
MYFQFVKLKRYYLGLGSNENDRFTQIQHAIFQLKNENLQVLACSTVYENAAQGFSGNLFYNACIAIETSLDAEALLNRCLSIEQSHGRDRQSGLKGYQNRPLDIDLLIGPEMIETPILRLPHPRMNSRRFVLEPMIEVATALKDQEQLKKLKLWLEQCEDQSTLTPVQPSLLCTAEALWQSSKTVVIEGCIGVGKTTLCHLLAKRYNLELHLERFESNPYLSKFYQEPEAYALPTELHFLADRHEALSELADRKGIVADYHISKSKLFAELNLKEDDLKLFNRFYSWSEKLTEAPSLYVLLDAPVELIENRIAQRARPYEGSIESSYLERIRAAYLQRHSSVSSHFLVDTAALDYVHQSADFDILCTQLTLALLAQRLNSKSSI